tara:strand:- start:1033 stop:1743 length:711 start_codon:yes stop_codon:yes gene_type:complete
MNFILETNEIYNIPTYTHFQHLHQQDTDQRDMPLSNEQRCVNRFNTCKANALGGYIASGTNDIINNSEFNDFTIGDIDNLIKYLKATKRIVLKKLELINIGYMTDEGVVIKQPKPVMVPEPEPKPVMVPEPEPEPEPEPVKPKHKKTKYKHKKTKPKPKTYGDHKREQYKIECEIARNKKIEREIAGGRRPISLEEIDIYVKTHEIEGLPLREGDQNWLRTNMQKEYYRTYPTRTK